MGCGATKPGAVVPEAWEKVVTTKPGADGEAFCVQRVHPINFDQLDDWTPSDANDDKNGDRNGKVPDVAQELAGVSTGSGSFSLPLEMFKELEVRYKERMDRMPMDLDSWCLNMPAPDTDQAMKELVEDLTQLEKPSVHSALDGQ